MNHRNQKKRATKIGDKSEPAPKPTLVLLDAKKAERSRTEKEADSMRTGSNNQTDSTSSTGDDRPRLHLLPGSAITFENVVKMFESLVGRPATPEEREEARKEWESDAGESKE
jgi:hypothetical protein